MIISKSKIIENQKIAHNIWRMTFSSQKIADEYKGAGQFITILASDGWENPIRRPMSIAKVIDDRISIIYKLVGTITHQLSNLVVDQYVDVMGPFGNTFDVNYQNFTPILIGGGIGLAPILNLYDYLKNKNVNCYTIIGAKNASEHFLEHDPNNKIYLTTDENNKGFKGNVIDGLTKIIDKVKNPQIYACGPEKMLKALKEYLKKKNISGQFSVESYMACGFGLCQGCAISKNSNDGYHLVCKDGPVFNYNEVIFG